MQITLQKSGASSQRSKIYLTTGPMCATVNKPTFFKGKFSIVSAFSIESSTTKSGHLLKCAIRSSGGGVSRPQPLCCHCKWSYKLVVGHFHRIPSTNFIIFSRKLLKIHLKVHHSQRKTHHSNTTIISSSHLGWVAGAVRNLVENRHFSGAILHYLCIFNRKCKKKVATITMQSAIGRMFREFQQNSSF